MGLSLKGKNIVEIKGNTGYGNVFKSCGLLQDCLVKV